MKVNVAQAMTTASLIRDCLAVASANNSPAILSVAARHLRQLADEMGFVVLPKTDPPLAQDPGDARLRGDDSHLAKALDNAAKTGSFTRPRILTAAEYEAVKAEEADADT